MDSTSPIRRSIKGLRRLLRRIERAIRRRPFLLAGIVGILIVTRAIVEIVTGIEALGAPDLLNVSLHDVFVHGYALFVFALTSLCIGVVIRTTIAVRPYRRQVAFASVGTLLMSLIMPLALIGYGPYEDFAPYWSVVAIVIGFLPLWLRLDVYQKRTYRLLSAAGASRQMRRHWFTNTPILKVGVLHYPPFTNVNPETRRPSGPFYDTICSLASEIGWKVEAECNHSLANLLHLLKTDQLDMVLPLICTDHRRSDGIGFFRFAPVTISMGALTIDPSRHKFRDNTRERTIDALLNLSNFKDLIVNKDLEHVGFIVNDGEVGDEWLQDQLPKDELHRIHRHEAINLSSVLGPLMVGEGDLILGDCVSLELMRQKAEQRKYAVRTLFWNPPLHRYPCTVAYASRMPESLVRWIEDRWTTSISNTMLGARESSVMRSYEARKILSILP